MRNRPTLEKTSAEIALYPCAGLFLVCVFGETRPHSCVSPVTVIASEEYIDYNLVMATTFGNPIGTGVIRGQLIVKCG